MTLQPTYAPKDFSAELKALARALSATEPSSSGQASGDLYQRFAEELVGNHDLDTILRYVLQQMAAAVSADRAYIALVDTEGLPIYSLILGQDGDVADLFPHSRTVIQRLMHAKQTVWIADAQNDPKVMPTKSIMDLELRMVIAVPMMLGKELIGLVYLDRRSINESFTPKDLALLESMAAYATLAVSNVRMTNEITGRAQKLQLINDVSLAISATLKLDQLLSLILNHSLSLSGGEQGYVLLGSDADMSCLASLDRQGKPIEDVGISRSIVSRCVTERTSICIMDTHEEPEIQTKSVMALDLRSVMCVPLVANQHWLGVLYISSQAITKTFTSQDQALLEAIANQAALAIRNAQLLKEQQQQIAELERALQMVREAQLKAVTDGLTGLYNHVYFKEQLYNSVLEAQRYGQSLSVIMIDLDHFKRINDTHGHQAGDGVLKQVSATLRKALRDCDILGRYGGEEFAILLPQTDQPGAAVVAERIRQSLANLRLPAPDGGEIVPTASLGVAGFRPGNTAIEVLERADKALYLAKHSGRNRVCLDGQDPSIASEGLPGLKEARDTISETFMNTVAALCEAVDAKDQYTAAHSHHIEALARRVGEALGLSGRQLKEVELAAVMHDVGKIGIPDAILQKPGPLTEDEWVIMRTHPVQGARILQAGNLHNLALAIRHHHEFWDGTGYPDGLKGEEIPLASRIVAVIDAYGAMVTDRVYRKAIGKTRAIEELRKHSGSQFDPKVVELFLPLIDI